MQSSAIEKLAERLKGASPADSHEQREIFERIRELRSAFEGPLDPDCQRYLEAAAMLVAYLARMGVLAGEDVRAIAVRLLQGAAQAEEVAAQSVEKSPAPAPPPVPPAPTSPSPTLAGQAPAQAPAPAPAQAPAPAPAMHIETRSATDVMGDMMLGQILLNRGHVLEEHIQQAMKVQRYSPIQIGDIFVKIGACSQAQVDAALAHQAALRRVRGNLAESAPRLAKVDTRGTGLKLVGEAMLGEILIERNVITRRQLDRALEVQKQSGVRIGEALVKIGATTMEQIEAALRVQGRDRRFGTKTTSELPHKGGSR